MKINTKSGFTLIEVIAAMMIVGVIGGFSLLFLMNSAIGFVTAQQNAILVQKARLTMARLAAEFVREMKSIDSFSPGGTQKSYVKTIYQYLPQKDRQIALVGTGARKKIILLDTQVDAPAETDDEVLVDNVSNFYLVFEKCDGSAWNTGDDMEDLCRIDIFLVLFVNQTDADTRTFNRTITPHNRDPVISVIETDNNDLV